jgi:two-component system, chemotaxis family, chemotaxis protein CheY
MVEMGNKILVVDDSTTVRQQLKVALGDAGFTVVEAVNGIDGLDQLAANRGLSLVICDVNMPQMSGLEMLEKIQSTGVGTGIPVIMLTTEGDPSLIARAKKAGAKGWIVKPFKPELLVAAARKLAV